ncbi:MAG: hypothetical protein KJ792_08945 [Actinobacteria bacterium]|nr:hypothetical protein [Actinomycetota bacterium]MCG2803221.1 hypothetical protein [Cellulomonas sp.]
MTGGPDWFARVLAVTAIAFSVLQFVITSRGDAWRRRAGNTADLRDVLAEVLATLATADTPRGAVNLWTASFDVTMKRLLEELAVVSDRKLTRLVRKLHRSLVSIRGMATPTQADLMGGGVVLSGEQRRWLEDARGSAKASVERVNLAIRKGGKQK